jgi:pilus assembly protein CpaF
MAILSELARNVRERVLGSESAAGLSYSQLIDETFDELALSGVVHPNEPTLRNQLDAQLFGFGPLQAFLADPLVEEVWINQPNQIYVARSGQVECIRANLPEDELRTLVLRMLRDTGRRVDTSLPFADAVLPDGSRLHVVIPDVTAKHWSVNIRKFPPKILRLSDLTAGQTLTQSQADFLRDSVLGGKNILISGATHTGKTTLLGALISEAPENTRLVSCEETFELRTTLTDWVAMQARQPNLEGKGEIPLRRLVKEALRMRPDRLVIGEVREAEALDLLVAMNSGVSGACTIHANSARAALTKLCTLPLLAGPNISPQFVLSTVGTAIDVVVQCVYLGDGRRRVAEIAEVGADATGAPTITNWVS